MKTETCSHNTMQPTGKASHAWKCADCGYVYGLTEATERLQTPITAQQFFVGRYRCRFGHALDEDSRPMPELCVWLWTGFYWQLLIRHCTDLDTAKYSATQELSQRAA